MNVFEHPDEEYPYMDTFNYFQEDWAYNYQPKGSRKEIRITGVLLQENLFDLLQEDGSQIDLRSAWSIFQAAQITLRHRCTGQRFIASED